MKTITTLLILSFLSTTFAQSPFDFETFNEAYEDLEGSISLNDGEIWDDPVYEIPLGFTFNLGEETFDTVYIIEDGAGGALSSDEIIDGGSFNVFLPVLQDIIDRGDFTGEMSLSNISYLTEGEVGNQITKIEYNNVGFFEDDTGEDFLNFQVWYYEANGFIEYRYGESSILNPDASYEGETGLGVGLLPLINGDFDVLEDAYFLANEPADPELIVFEAGSSINVLPTLVGDVPANTVYRFGPSALGVSSNELVDVSFYPNPVKNKLHVSYRGNINAFTIYDASGRKILNLKTQHDVIDVSSLDQGIYYVKMETDEGPMSTTILKK